MNLFEKIFSYQLSSRLEENDLYTLTSQERAWLRMMLSHPAAEHAFDPETRARLEQCTLDDEPPVLQHAFIEKAGTTDGQSFLPWLRILRRIMRSRRGMLLGRFNKHGEPIDPQRGIPWRLEYSMARREWYLYWFNLSRSAPMITRLAHVQSVETHDISTQTYIAASERMDRFVQMDRHEAVVQVLPMYNEELTRILHAFSCFDKKVEFDEQLHTYWIHVHFTGSESEYVLNRLRFLGKRVKVVEGDHLKQRMRETALRALARYGDVQVEESEQIEDEAFRE